MASFIGGIILWWVDNGAGHDLVDGNCVGFIDIVQTSHKPMIIYEVEIRGKVP